MGGSLSEVGLFGFFLLRVHFTCPAGGLYMFTLVTCEWLVFFCLFIRIDWLLHLLGVWRSIPTRRIGLFLFAWVFFLFCLSLSIYPS